MIKTNRRSMKSTFFILLSALLISNGALAQGGDGGFDQTQIITGDRALTVQKVFKITELPTVVDIPVELSVSSYSVIPRRPATAISVDTIEAAKIKVREPLEKLYQGFVKAGVGTFATPYIEAFYTSSRDRDLAYGIHARHMSALDGVNRPVAFSGYSDNEINLWGKKIYRDHSLKAGLAFDRNTRYYYGFDPQDADIDKKDIRQSFNNFMLDAEWNSYYRDSSRLNHDIGFETYLYNDRYDASEFGIKATADLRTYRGAQFYTLNSGFDFIGYSSDELGAFDFMGDTSGLAVPGSSFNNAIVHATPRILLRSGKLKAMVGLGLYGQFDSKARFHAFPDAEVSYALFDHIFVPYAGITGRVDRNSFKSLTTQNPWLLSNSPLSNSVVKYDVYGGIRGSISDRLSFNTRVGYKRVTDTPLFINDTLISLENRFSVVYDAVNTFSLLGELTYTYSDKWSAGLSGEVFSYDTDKEERAWHLPAYRFALTGNYNLFDKFKIGTEMALVGSRDVKSLFPVAGIDVEADGNTIIALDAYFDLSLQLEYQYSPRLSAFVEGHNITGSKYDIYYRFPTQRVFIMGGVKFAF